ncbi:unnamed protein product [Strongylus vulgaris]|uniref:Uncharacterized protein n=1 Tax=Strongylus vulgaris TaxID=40348 RepID=A0A3P7LUR0_STRVU|nr:unnamed protein product [Strongylus vulgaris]
MYKFRVRRTPPLPPPGTTVIKKTTVYLAPRVRHWFQRPLPNRPPPPMQPNRPPPLPPQPKAAWWEYAKYYQSPHQECVTCAVIPAGSSGK